MVVAQILVSINRSFCHIQATSKYYVQRNILQSYRTVLVCMSSSVKFTVFADGELVRMTEWERQRERDEFARMRRVYQPLAVSLSTRFTREGDTKEKEEVRRNVYLRYYM